jgi:hypothetical protein
MIIDQVAHQQHIYLTTTGRWTGNPHTVELWFALEGDSIYLSHEGKYTDWMKNIVKDNEVEFRIGHLNFKGCARIIHDKETFDIGKHALYRKYFGQASEAVINDWFSLSTIIIIINIGRKSNPS